MLRWPAFAWPRGVREAGLAFVIALAVLFVLTAIQNSAVIRGLETASLDLRFRLRGVQTRPTPKPSLCWSTISSAYISWRPIFVPSYLRMRRAELRAQVA